MVVVVGADGVGASYRRWWWVVLVVLTSGGGGLVVVVGGAGGAGAIDDGVGGTQNPNPWLKHTRVESALVINWVLVPWPTR